MNKRVVMLAGVLCVLTVTAHSSTREMWTWTDANGVTHYSDTPVQGAKKIQLSGYGAPTPAPTTVATTPAARPAPEDARAVQYRSVNFTQPEEGASFFGADASVNVAIETDPALAQGHRVVIYFDGKLMQGESIGNLARGAHTLVAAIQDEAGTVLLRSAPRTIYVQQPSVNNPAAVGPALKPRPTPLPAPTPRSPK
ncbi:MAG: hypothetical protein RLZ98_3735 [Pseudomonadota bacterium]|jgi:hypothetical protein